MKAFARVTTGKDGLEQRTATANTPDMRLFHFSDDPGITEFVPRPVGVPAERKPHMEWLNGPLVWAIEEDWQPLYLFPRDCPRILIRPKATSVEADLLHWFPAGNAQTIIYIETAWRGRLSEAKLSRYELLGASFEPLSDAGMWVSRQSVVPVGCATLSDLPKSLANHGVELRVVDSLLPLRDIWSTSLHVSGVRLRNALDWLATGQPLRATRR